jgi:hypothetical protein
VTRQQFADDKLRQWQDLRSRGLTPEERIEMLFYDFFLPPPPCDVEYAIIENQVREAMSQ